MMKKWFALGSILIVGIAAVSTAVFAGDTPKPEKGLIVGEVIDIISFAMKGEHGAEFAEAGIRRAEQGFPIAIIEEETGDVWICVYKDPAPASHLHTGNKALGKYMGQKVVVQGLKYRAQGVNVIRVSAASEY